MHTLSQRGLKIIPIPKMVRKSKERGIRSYWSFEIVRNKSKKQRKGVWDATVSYAFLR